jgi:hypothetical protein
MHLLGGAAYFATALIFECKILMKSSWSFDQHFVCSFFEAFMADKMWRKKA